MLLDTDYILPTTLTGYVRQSLAASAYNKFTLARWLPWNNIDDLDYRVMTGNTGLADAATFRTFDAETPIGRRLGLQMLRGELPPISQKLRLGEYDRLRQRKLAQLEVETALFRDADRLTDNLSARFELARGQALATGQVTISENGITGVVVDYARTSAHTVTAATLWSGAADPLSDLMTWRDTYIATTGVDPQAIVASRRIVNVLLRNQAVRNQVFPGANQPSIVTQVGLNQVLEAQGLPPIYQYNAQVNVNKVATKVIPDNVLLYLPAPVDPNSPQDTQFGATFLGTTAESLDPSYSLEGGDEPGIVAGVYSDNDPIALWTKCSAIGLPVLANANLSLAATVL